MQYATSMPSAVHVATVPAAPKSTSSGCAVTTSTRVTSVRTRTDRRGVDTQAPYVRTPCRSDLAAEPVPRAVQCPLGGHPAARGEDRAEQVDGHRAAERQQEADRRDGRGADRGPATLLDEHRRALPGDAPLAGSRAEHG